MKKIEAVIRPSRFEAVKEALLELGVRGMTVSYVHGEVLGTPQMVTYRCQKARLDLTARIKVEVVVGAREADEVVQAVIGAARTGEIDDGLVLVYDIAEAIRVCNYQRDEAAV